MVCRPRQSPKPFYGGVAVAKKRRAAKKKSAKKTAKKSSKSREGKPSQPEPEAIISEPVKLHYLVDRRDFLEKVKSVYASYAG